MIIVLPEMLEEAWARALPGRECAERNEVLRLWLTRSSDHPGRFLLRSTHLQVFSRAAASPKNGVSR
jgi:hypothetical protein